MNQALEDCARDFDEILRDAKDRLFHIRSAEQPDGMIILDLTPEALQLVRSIALWSPDDFDSFFEVAVATLWAALDPSLARVRRFISTELKSAIIDRLERARAEVRAVAAADPAFHGFDIEFGQRSTEVQRALDDAASWFTYTRAERLKRTFTLEEAVRIGRENALRSQRVFEPQLTETVEGGIEITAPSLVIIHDTLFTALDNIRMHSGLKTPKVEVSIAHDSERGTLSIEVVSRKGLSDALAAVGPGDTLIVWRLDRLGRSLPHLIAVVTELGERGVGFQSLHDGLDTSSAQGRLVFHMMGALAEFERALISERTQAGVRAAKARGVRLGRRPTLSGHQIEHARTLIAGGESPSAVARTFRVGRSTLYRALQATPGTTG